MNDERVPINLYKLDSGYNDKGMDGKELIKDYKQNIQKWCFIAVADIVCSWDLIPLLRQQISCMNFLNINHWE